MCGAGCCAVSAALAMRMRRPVRQSHDLVFGDNALDLLQPIFVEGKDGLSDKLLFLEFVNNVAIVA